MTPPDLTEQELAELDAKAEAATPGPWRHSEMVREGPGPTSTWIQKLPADAHVVDSRGTPFAFGVNVAATAEAADAAYLCAASPDVVRRLVAEVRRGRVSEAHCASCTCGKRRAPMQGEWKREPEKVRRVEGTITWDEHVKCYAAYAAKYGRAQSAERIAERGGFSFEEFVRLVGHEPKTWRPR